MLQASFVAGELRVAFDLVAGELLVAFDADLVGAHQVSFDPAFAALELLASFVGLVGVAFDPAAGELLA